MPEAPEVLEETVTVEEDPGTPTSHVSIVTSEDGTTRRTETKVGLGSGWGYYIFWGLPVCHWVVTAGPIRLSGLSAAHLSARSLRP